jgi:putative flippase GtrA
MSIAMRPVQARELAAFGIVGGAAFAVHVAVVSLLVPQGLPPLAANVVAFALAFGVSFVGHARWSFPASGRAVVPALVRFAVVAVGAFAFNETAYAALLAWTPLDYRVALVIVLAGVAGFTFVTGRHWAFATGSTSAVAEGGADSAGDRFSSEPASNSTETSY